MAGEIIHRVVHRRAVVPERERAGLPLHAALELRACRVPAEIVDQRLRLLGGHVLEADGVQRIQVERLDPGLGVGADHGVLDCGDRILLRDLHLLHTVPEARRVRAVGALVAEHCDEAVEHRPHAVGERPVAGAHVREQPISAVRGKFRPVEHRAEGGMLRVAQIAVPAIAEVMDVVGLLDDAEHVGVPLQGFHVGMPIQLAEPACELGERARFERLVTKDQHQVLQQPGANRGDGVVVKLARQIDARHFGAQGASDSPEPEPVGVIAHNEETSRELRSLVT